MSLEDKRRLYACGTKYITLEQVDSWSQHVTVGKTDLPSGMLLQINNVIAFCLSTPEIRYCDQFCFADVTVISKTLKSLKLTRFVHTVNSWT